MKSIIIQPEHKGYCCICGKPYVEEHHCFGGNANRRLADEDGLTLPLCPEHHNSGNMSVHMNKEMKVMSHMIGQLAYELEMVSTGQAKTKEEAKEMFRRRYGKSYL